MRARNIPPPFTVHMRGLEQYNGDPASTRCLEARLSLAANGPGVLPLLHNQYQPKSAAVNTPLSECNASLIYFSARVRA